MKEACDDIVKACDDISKRYIYNYRIEKPGEIVNLIGFDNDILINPNINKYLRAVCIL